jgi:hypothetical protein
MNQPTSTIPLKRETVHDLFRLSSRLAELSEEILEEQGEFSEEFLRGLQHSLSDADTGKVRAINSLQEI